MDPDPTHDVDIDIDHDAAHSASDIAGDDCQHVVPANAPDDEPSTSTASTYTYQKVWRMGRSWLLTTHTLLNHYKMAW